MITRVLALLACACLAFGCSTSAPKARPGTQTANVFHTVVRHDHRLGYLLYVPEGAEADSAKRWPLMLFLHGSGERGTNINLVAVHGPPKLVAAGRKFPFILVSPQCPPGAIWNDEALMALVDELGRTLPVDPRRIYATGLSMGGYGVWDLAARHPERFAAVAPICGGGERIRPSLLSAAGKEAIKTLGIWAFHGAKDDVVPLEESERMVAAFRKNGATDVRLTVYPDARHDSWTRAYDDPALYEWLLGHAR